MSILPFLTSVPKPLACETQRNHADVRDSEVSRVHRFLVHAIPIPSLHRTVYPLANKTGCSNLSLVLSVKIVVSSLLRRFLSSARAFSCVLSAGPAGKRKGRGRFTPRIACILR